MGKNKPIFKRIAIIGQGLIGSSLSRAIREFNASQELIVTDKSDKVQKRVSELGLALVAPDPQTVVCEADFVIMAVPVSEYKGVAEEIGPYLKDGAIISDVGSVKRFVIKGVVPFIPAHAHFVPAHPVAGTEQSGPDAGFAELFINRWCILTPLPNTPEDILEKVERFWKGLGSHVERMSVEHHDKVLALTSHLPHLIAYTIVGTASHHEKVTNSEAIKFSAGGFRDFTRIAASNPTMWRDIFLSNKDAVLEMLARFNEDIADLAKAIRWGDADTLFERFSNSRITRRRIIEAGQDLAAPDFGRRKQRKVRIPPPYGSDLD